MKRETRGSGRKDVGVDRRKMKIRRRRKNKQVSINGMDGQWDNKRKGGRS